MTLRVVELYCGIGGCSAALAPALSASSPLAEVVQAVDMSSNALAVYQHNFPRHPCRAAAVESLSAEQLESLAADLWWLSPPCQPFTRRGKRGDADDPRAATFLAMIDRLGRARPPWVALENVPGFVGSRVHRHLLDTLEQAGYGEVFEQVLCPSQLGWPNRRERYYLVASNRALARLDPTARALEPSPAGEPVVRLAELVEHRDFASTPEALRIAPTILQRYERAIDRVDFEDPRAVTACFTSAYGRSPVRSGSYLRWQEKNTTRLRRFSPSEILRLLGFPATFRLPPGLEPRRAWPLVGNSLSLPAVRAVLRAVPPLSGCLGGESLGASLSGAAIPCEASS